MGAVMYIKNGSILQISSMVLPWVRVYHKAPAARSYRILGTGRKNLSVSGPLGTIWDLWGPSRTFGDHLWTIWEIDSMKLSVSLRIRTFRSARIDPSSLPKHRRTSFKKSCRRKKSHTQKEWKKIKNGQNGHSTINLICKGNRVTTCKGC